MIYWKIGIFQTCANITISVIDKKIAIIIHNRIHIHHSSKHSTWNANPKVPK